MNYTIVALAAASLLGSWWLTGAVRRYALARSVLDVPNERSSHTAPTPRGGGLGIAICYTLSLPVLWLLGLLDDRLALALGGASLVAAGGWWDDHADLDPRTRIAIQLGAACWTVYWLGGFPTANFGIATVHLGDLGAPLAVVGLLWLTNLYNFMDGIDGLAGSEAVVAAVVGAIMFGGTDAVGLAAVSAVLCAASLGFLAWNWPPAKVFMGDVASGLLGFAFAALALSGERVAQLSAVALLIPLGVFICDATYTILRRLARREKIYTAHRTHIYQQLVRCGWSHRSTTKLIIAANIGLSALALFAWRRPAALLPAAGTAVAGLALLGWLALRVTRTAAPPPPPSPSRAG